MRRLKGRAVAGTMKVGRVLVSVREGMQIQVGHMVLDMVGPVGHSWLEIARRLVEIGVDAASMVAVDLAVEVSAAQVAKMKEEGWRWVAEPRWAGCVI